MRQKRKKARASRERNSSGKGRAERSAKEERLEGSQKRGALLVEAGQIAADARERAGSAVGAECAGHFLLDLEHAQVALRLVVVERDGEVVEEVLGQGLFDPSALLGAALGR